MEQAEGMATLMVQTSLNYVLDNLYSSIAWVSAGSLSRHCLKER